MGDFDTFSDLFPTIRHRLMEPEFIKYMIDDMCLLDSEFNDDESYKLVDVWNSHGTVYFEFKNDEDDEVTISLRMEHTRGS